MTTPRTDRPGPDHPGPDRPGPDRPGRVHRRSAVDALLTGARLDTPPYTARELAAAETRLAARLADRMRDGALSFDDAVRHAATGVRAEPAERLRPDQTEQPETHEAAEDLQRLCRLVVGRPDALHQMATFIGGRVPEPDGARVLACVLELADREDSARFWWQYAAGAGDTTAAYCLYLHHLTLSEVGEALWWHAQTGPGDDRRPLPGARPAVDPYDAAVVWGVRLEAATEGQVPPATAEAVAVYVTNAVEYVEELDLPLPPAGFAERIEELTARG
ncbi:hypothetical protein [Streptomyces sp. NPDC037389]|uniref:hypothetical protein n=1 Tax=Streptomyces sp. NPDC037389 TaxID=3155369 RepID=UPI0033C975A7